MRSEAALEQAQGLDQIGNSVRLPNEYSHGQDTPTTRAVTLRSQRVVLRSGRVDALRRRALRFVANQDG